MTTLPPSIDSTTQNALREAFDALLDLPPDLRPSWLDSHVPDSTLRERLQRLLAAHAGRGFHDTVQVDPSIDPLRLGGAQHLRRRLVR